MKNLSLWAVVGAILVASPSIGCSCSTPSGASGDGGSGGGMDAGDSSTSNSPDTGEVDGTSAALDGAIVFGMTQCSNGQDDDGDGEVDGFDRECTGPADNDENSFGTGIPGDNRDPDCQDCFFDGNSGSGDDGCRYATSCLETGEPTSGSGSCATCEPSEACLENGCLDATPNGCDCFGCCEVHTGGDVVHILIGGACSIEQIDDTTICPRCMPNDTCRNDCGRCELCLGRTPDELPADCTPDGGTSPYQCDDGTTCAADTDCPTGESCQLGCCLVILL
jgi:hypothetical protein